MHSDDTPTTGTQQYRGSFQQLADARRILRVSNSIRCAPVLSVEARQELARIRALAIRCISATVEELLETLDIALGDADAEDADPCEDGDEDRCAAADDDPARLFGDGIPGDEADREDDDPGGGAIDDEPHDPYTEDGL